MCSFEFSSWDGCPYEITGLKTFDCFLARQIASGKPKTIESGALVTSASGSFDGKDRNVPTLKL
jgi:hypothetical protein